MTNIGASAAMRHVCSFYNSDGQRTEILTHILGLEFEKGKRVIYMADTDTSDSAWERLSRTGLDTAAYSASGVLQAVSGRDTYGSNGPASADSLFAWMQRTVEEVRTEGLSFVSEKGLFFSRDMDETELLKYEGRVNDFSPAMDCALWCLYDQRLFSGEMLLEVLAVHPQILKNGVVYSNPSYLPPSVYFAPQRTLMEFNRRLQQIEGGKDENTPIVRESEIKDIFSRVPLLSALIENLREGLEVIDCSGKILFVNKKLCELVGYSAEELLGKRFVDFLSQEERKQFLSQVANCNTSTVKRFEVTYPRKDGEQRVFKVTHHPRTDENGILIGSFGLVSDITEEQRLARMKDDVDRLMRNELRTPLKSIMSLTHLMLMEKTGGRCADYATELNGIASNMMKFLDLSREIYRMEQGGYEPDFAWFDFRKIFRNINRIISPRAEVNLVRVIYHNDPENGLGKLQHYGEQVLLESMLVNLIKNAVEVSKNGEEVTVIFECSEKEVQISVHDNGYLSQQKLHRFFDKYSSDGKEKGSGVARYSAKLIAEAHGGNIMVESEKEQGTVVSIVLPRRHVHE